jgi:serine/threonine protein kinase
MAGQITINAGDCNALISFGDGAFKQASNAASSVTFRRLIHLQTISNEAFKDYTGKLVLIFDPGTTSTTSKLTDVGHNIFVGASNTESYINLPKVEGSLPLLELAIDYSFAGSIAYGVTTTTTTTITTTTATTTTASSTTTTSRTTTTTTATTTTATTTTSTTTTATTTTTTVESGTVCDISLDSEHLSHVSIREPAVLSDYQSDVKPCTTGSLCRYYCCSLSMVDAACPACDRSGNCLDPLALTPNTTAPSYQDGWPTQLTNNNEAFVRPAFKTVVSGNCTFQRGNQCISSPADLTNTDESIPLIKYMLRWGEPTTSTSTLRTDFVGRPPPLNGLYDTGQDHDPGLVNIDQDTGQIVAVPVETGTYTMWFIAYEANRASAFGEQINRENIPPEQDQVVLEVWEFEVVKPQEFGLVLEFDPAVLLPADVGLEDATETDASGPIIKYAIGSTIEFPEMNLAKEAMFLNPASNDFAKITFKRNFNESLSADSPGLWLVDTETGAMLAKPERAGSYTVQLLAVDGGGAEVEVRSWSFEVVEADVFQVHDWEWNMAGIATINADDYVYQNKSTLSNTSANIYAVGDTYQFAPINIMQASGAYNGETFSDLTFTIVDAPPGFLIDPQNGFIQGTPTKAGLFTMQIKAIDGDGAESTVATIVFDVRTGPNGKPCTNGGQSVPFDDYEFGAERDKTPGFSCNCSETTTTDALSGFEGENCQDDIAKREAQEQAASSEQDADASKRTSKISVGAAAGVIVLILLVIAAVKYQQKRIAMRPVDFDAQFALMVSWGVFEPEHVKVKMKPREIRRKDLTLVKVIGSGAFGEVYKAQLDESFTRSTPEYTVAAKTVLDAKTSPEATREMLAEAGVMAAVGSHPNLVSLIGVITRGDPLVLILQFCSEGELLSKLKKAAAEGEPISLTDKMQMAREVAQGMDHLSQNHFIHRDLACRNVLYAEGMCKVADFGLSRGTRGGQAITPDEWTHSNADRVDRGETHEDYYKSTTGVFPVRWTAPEAMETLRFTPASDVWSFGIVVLELLLDGVTPYHGMSNPEVMKLTMSGGRHVKPDLCSIKLYHVLLQCWDADPDGRPSFTQLCNAFKEMQTVSSKSADANAARVEAAANDKLKRGSAANAYAGFGEERAEPTCVMPEHAGYIYEVPNCGVPNVQPHQENLLLATASSLRNTSSSVSGRGNGSGPGYHLASAGAVNVNRSRLSASSSVGFARSDADFGASMASIADLHARADADFGASTTSFAGRRSFEQEYGTNQVPRMISNV